MDHGEDNQVLQALYDGEPLEKINTNNRLTSINMVNNYKVISDWLDRELTDKKKFDEEPSMPTVSMMQERLTKIIIATSLRLK